MRYFLEVSYKGTAYSGFQEQENANTVQAEVTKAFAVLIKVNLQLTGSSRTDAGVHALQNFFHFDTQLELKPELLYNLNAILPPDIAVKNLFRVKDDAHCRFDAVSRQYRYFIYSNKNPFLVERAFFYPYKLDIDIMCKAAEVIKGYNDFTSFSKRNTQVKTFQCEITESEWYEENDCLVYKVRANRFLRGMVRALTATMLQVGRGKIDLDQFRQIIEAKDCTQASFGVPAHGLFLTQVQFPSDFFKG
jgi:tRNA pseudouridine38-40 synthase